MRSAAFDLRGATALTCGAAAWSICDLGREDSGRSFISCPQTASYDNASDRRMPSKDYFCCRATPLADDRSARRRRSSTGTCMVISHKSIETSADPFVSLRDTALVRLAELACAGMANVSVVICTQEWVRYRAPHAVASNSEFVQEESALLVAALGKTQPFILSNINPRSLLACAADHDRPWNIKSCLCVPLVASNGARLGTLCAMSAMPERFSNVDLDNVTNVATVVTALLSQPDLDTLSQGAKQAADLAFQRSFDDLPIGVFQLEESGRLLWANQYCLSLLGRQRVELGTITLADITHPDDVLRSMQQLTSAVAGRLDRYAIEKRYRRHDGTYFWASVLVSAKHACIDDGGYLLAVIDDISARKLDEFKLDERQNLLEFEVQHKSNELEQSNEVLRSHVSQLSDSKQTVQHLERRLRTITDNLPVYIGYWNHELRCEFANDAYRATFDLSREKMLGMHMRDVLGEERFRDSEPYAKRALAGMPQQWERMVVNASGGNSYFDVRFLPDREHSPSSSGFFVLVTDVTTARNVQIALEAANAKLSNNNFGDYLTGLANRRRLDLSGGEALELCRSGDERFGLLLIDLDEFVKINSAHNYEVGDRVLCEVAAVIKTQLRNHRDVAARLVGAKFAVLSFGEIDTELLWIVAEELRRQLRHVTIAELDISVDLSASVGITLCHAEDDQWEAIYARADTALHEAKLNGKNCIVTN